MAELFYHVARADPRSDGVLAFLFESLGIDAMPCPPPELWERPHLVYGGESSPRPNGIIIREHSGDVFWHELLGGVQDPASPGGEVLFDVIGAIGALLRDEVHDDPEPGSLDVHDRLRYEASLPARSGFGDLPVVDLYVAFLGRLLRARLGVTGRARWPAGRIAAIGLSHDVDNPDRYALLESATRPWRWRRNPRAYLRGTLKLARARASDPNPRDFWLFNPLTESESRLGFRSTFFFAAVPFHARLGAPVDVAYDVGRRPFRRLFRSLTAEGFEIGLHASYRAFEDPARLVAERARLGIQAQTEIVGLRHHYWHLGHDIAATLRSHEEAGFEYDSSLAFNDHIGFRRSVALPFHPFDPVLMRPLRTMQLPTFCMDGNLFYTSDDVDGAVEAVDKLISRIIEVGGMGSIDWHIQTSFPANAEFRGWGLAYQEILRLLAERRDVWVTDLGTIAAWVTERAARIRAPRQVVSAMPPVLPGHIA